MRPERRAEPGEHLLHVVIGPGDVEGPLRPRHRRIEEDRRPWTEERLRKIGVRREPERARVLDGVIDDRLRLERLDAAQTANLFPHQRHPLFQIEVGLRRQEHGILHAEAGAIDEHEPPDQDLPRRPPRDDDRDQLGEARVAALPTAAHERRPQRPSGGQPEELT